MKVLSIIQPWATLIALGEKKFETRSWATKYRGELAIHASKKIDKDTCRTQPIVQTLNKYGIALFDDLPTGSIIAIGQLTACHKSLMDFGFSALLDNGIRIEGNEYAFGHYTEGRFAWELADIKLIDSIPAKGQLGLWNYNEVNHL